MSFLKNKTWSNYNYEIALFNEMFDVRFVYKCQNHQNSGL